ncbi:hypothetical protein [Psychroserpens algicola]|uniref:hypothetical protein n=1 Tax=Psychroserpens algicola TaxID=1719034 RepID=UPI001954034E|nr:hypothetical protein [Psychroserpens algicola]
MNGHDFFFGLLMIFLISAPIYIFRYWKKENNLSALDIIKIIWRKFHLFFIVILWMFISDLIIPLNKNHGIDFNSERQKLGIPIIEKDWVLSTSESSQFETYWWKPEPRIGHFKKVIKYGILNIKSETDYYMNKTNTGIYLCSIYDFGNKNFEYFIEKPNDKLISKTESGRLKFEKPTRIEKIDLSEFEQFIQDTIEIKTSH